MRTEQAAVAAHRLGDAESIYALYRHAREYRRWLRAQARASRNVPVVVVSGATPPELVGEGWCFRTRGGKKIAHPNAYAKCGWSSMVYHASTLAVRVGDAWLAARAIAPEVVTLGVRA